MRVIDAHMHFSDLESMRAAAHQAGVDYSLEGMRSEHERAGVVLAICMGIAESGEQKGRHRLLVSRLYRSTNPMLPGMLERCPPRLARCLGINPIRLRSEAAQHDLDQIERGLQQAPTVGLKLYPGYFPYPVDHVVYGPIYELAARYQVPVVVHGGETFAYGADDKLAHPSYLEAAARAHPDVTLVLAHFGYPWFEEAAAVARAAANVVIELSGFVEGGAEAVERARRHAAQRERIVRSLAAIGDWTRVIFGTDWPLVPVVPYVEFIAELIPEPERDRVFFSNALRVFPGLDRLL